MPKAAQLSGVRFGKLVAVEKAAGGKNAMWKCACDCGADSVVAACHLKSGHTKSCGCHKEMVLSQGTNKDHGRSRGRDRTYKTWKEMRQRCNNPKSDKWKWYGGRGIIVCERWESFSAFVEDMGDRPEAMTIDRIDNDGPYSPENCQWATHKEQTRKQDKNKLSVELAEKLRADAEYGMSFRKLGAKYGVSATTAHRCATGVTWAK